MHNRLGHRFQRRLDVPVWLERGPQGIALSYSDKVNALGPIAYWRLNETVGPTADNYEGTAARDGTYINTPTLNQTGIGDGLGAPLFDPPSSENVNIYSASLEAAFNPSEGTLAMWVKMRDAAVWTDAVFRCPFTLRVDGANEIQFSKASGGAFVSWLYFAGGVSEQIISGAQVTADWFHMAMTWSVAADEMKAYLNGVQEGATQTVLGVWAGALDVNRCRIADRGPGFSPHDGYGAHVAFFDNARSDADILSMATV